MLDPITSLAHNLHTSKGVYALLLGSGLSRAAGIPTGWEIVEGLIRRIAKLEGVDPATVHDPSAWYREAKGDDPDYSRLLDSLAATQEERRAVLHSYIDPGKEELEEGLRAPTKAHRAIARIVKNGYIRVILTTNFDRLIENALREVGVEPTVLSSIDDIKGAPPLPHCRCIVVKLHGDYLIPG
jgi:NAD-dependent SIR2 family protein deacetylase